MRILSLLIVTLLAQTPVRPSGLAGMVVKHDTGAPLSRATVVLQGEGDLSLPIRGNPVYTAITSNDGKFSFADVSPGRYRLSATREGYVPAELGVVGPDGCGAPVTVEAGQQRTDLSVAMVSAGVIAGRLIDRDGEPASNVTVQAIRYTYQNGSRVLTSVQSVQTNDLGEYRLFYLPPGRYLVAAALESRGNVIFAPDGAFFEFSRSTAGGLRLEAQGAAEPVVSPPPPAAPARPLPPNLPGTLVLNGPAPAVSNPGPRIAPVYYPSSSDPKTAAPIEVRAGETFQGADMVVTRVELRSIKGTVQNVGSRETFQRMTVSLISGVAHPNGSALRSANVRPDGSFEMPSVLPGSYSLLAAGNDATGRLTGRASVDVFANDVQNVQVAVSKGFSLSGRVSSDTVETSARITGVSLLPISEDRSVQTLMSLQSNVTNGAFTIDAIPPGTYLAYVSFSAPNSIYIKSMRLGSSDVRNDIRLDTQPNAPLEITVGSNGGTVEGVALGEKGQPVRGATVVLVPDVFLRQRSSSFKTTTTDSTGAFRIPAIGPGDYKVFAWETVETGAWEDPDYLRPYETRGQSLALREGIRQTVQLTAIPSTGPIYGQCQPYLGPR